MEVIRLRSRPDLLQQTAELLNSEWPRSLTARMFSLEENEDDLPCSLVVERQVVVGHVRLIAAAGRPRAMLVEALLVNSDYRGKGFGKKLMLAAEQYAVSLHYHTIHLSTHDKQSFYYHLGYQDGTSTSALRNCVTKLSKEQTQALLHEEELPSHISTPSLDHLSSLNHPLPPPLLPLQPPPPLPPPPPPLLPPSPLSVPQHTLTWLQKTLIYYDNI